MKLYRANFTFTFRPISRLFRTTSKNNLKPVTFRFQLYILKRKEKEKFEIRSVSERGSSVGPVVDY